MHLSSFAEWYRHQHDDATDDEIEQQFDIVSGNRSLWDRIEASIARGYANIAQSVATATEMLSGGEPNEAIESHVKKVIRENPADP